MNKFRTMPARQVDYPAHLHELQEGDFVIYHVNEETQTAQMSYRPPGCDMVYSAPLTMDETKQDKSGTSGTYWFWDRDMQNPTCRPSFGVPASPPYRWHGFLTKGVWEACE